MNYKNMNANIFKQKYEEKKFEYEIPQIKDLEDKAMT